MKDLVKKISAQEAEICIVGLGYVGLPLAMRFIEAGFKVTGYDVDEQKIEALKGGTSYISHIDAASFPSLLEKGVCSFSSDPQSVSSADVIILCLPTPLGAHFEPDLSFITSTLDRLSSSMRKHQVLCLESTTYPGTTDEILVPRIEHAGFNVGKDFYVVYSPEREDPGNTNYSTQSIPKLCGGHTDDCLAVGVALYGAIIDHVVPVRSTRIAEMAKLLENIQRAVNIGLMNEMKMVCDAMEIDVFEVINAAATKPFGFSRYTPGPGLGGHCIPIDPFYLSWKAKEYGVNTKFIELAGEVNEGMPKYVVNRITEALNDHGKSLKDAKVLVLGLAYKKNVDDMRESPSVTITDLLINKSASVTYSDPHIPHFPATRKIAVDMESQSLSPEIISRQDVVVLCTDHDLFDYAMIEKYSNLVVDSRGVFNARLPKVYRA